MSINFSKYINQLFKKITEPILLFSCKHKYFSWLSRIMLALGVNPNCTDAQGNTPLIWACKNKLESTAKLLLSKNADATIANSRQLIPIYFAMRNNLTNVVYSIIDVRNNSGDTPLMYSLKNGLFDMAKCLITKNANLDLADNSGDTPLIFTIKRNIPDIPELLIKQGANLNISDKSGNPPLMCAIQHKNAALSIVLIDAGANVNAQNNDGVSPVMYACKYNTRDIAKKLLSSDEIDINLKDKYGSSPLMYACIYKLSNIAKKILSHGADINLQNNDGHTPLILACKHQLREVAEKLIKMGVNVNCPDYVGHYPLMYTCSNKNNISQSIAIVLVDNGANVNIMDELKTTPLMYACQYKSTTLLTKLIDKGANIDATDCSGMTPLMYASKSQFVDGIIKLIKKNANPNIKSYTGETALSLSCKYNIHLDIITLLLNHGANPNIFEKNHSPLELICTSETCNTNPSYIENIAKSLIDHGADIGPLLSHELDNLSCDIFTKVANHFITVNISARYASLLTYNTKYDIHKTTSELINTINNLRKFATSKGVTSDILFDSLNSYENLLNKISPQPENIHNNTSTQNITNISRAFFSIQPFNQISLI